VLCSKHKNQEKEKIMADERKQSLFIVAYEGTDTAEAVYQTLRDLQKDKKVKIKTAATIYRKDNGKLKLTHKKRMTTIGGAALGTAIGFLLGGPGVGAAVGAAVGGYGSHQRSETKKFLDDKLGADDSAIAILISDADWEAVAAATEGYGGEDLKVELTPEAEEQLKALSEKAGVAEAVAEDVEVEVDDED
jgi:uncharacterized membrane protein